MKAQGSIQAVRMWCGICTDPVLKCFDNSEGLSCMDFLVNIVPELWSWLIV
jgi:hypothetical protein